MKDSVRGFPLLTDLSAVQLLSLPGSRKAPVKLQCAVTLQKAVSDPSAAAGLWGGGASPADWSATSALLVKNECFPPSHPILPQTIRNVSAWNGSTSGTDPGTPQHTGVGTDTLQHEENIPFPREMLHMVLGKAQRTFGFSLYQRAESSAVVVSEHGADVGIKCSTFWKKISSRASRVLPACCKRQLRLPWTPGK